MRWGTLASAVVLVSLSACAGTADTDHRGPVLPGNRSAEPAPPPPTPTGEPDDDGALTAWKAAILDRADAETLKIIREDIEARLQRFATRDAELALLPPGIAIEERIRVARRIAYEKARLALVEAKE
jgi:hypothetical protein